MDEFVWLDNRYATVYMSVCECEYGYCYVGMCVRVITHEIWRFISVENNKK